MSNIIRFQGKTFDTSPGSAFDCGQSDNYNWQPFDPHYYVGGRESGSRHTAEHGTQEYFDYESGWKFNDKHGARLNWGI